MTPLRRNPLLCMLVATAWRLASSTPARAEDPSCQPAYERAQELRLDGHLVSARSELRACARACSAELAKDCQTWLGQIEQQIGRIVIVVSDRDGKPTTDVQVSIDGTRDMAGAWQRGIDVDPGDHTVSATAGAERVDRTVRIDGGRSIRLDLSFAPPVSAPSPDAPKPASRTGFWMLAATGATLALGGGGLLGYGHWLRGEHETACPAGRPCADAERRRSEVTALWASGGVALGVGLPALLGGIVMLSLPSPAASPKAVSAVSPLVDGHGLFGLSITGSY